MVGNSGGSLKTDSAPVTTCVFPVGSVKKETKVGLQVAFYSVYDLYFCNRFAVFCSSFFVAIVTGIRELAQSVAFFPRSLLLDKKKLRPAGDTYTFTSVL